MIGFTLMNHQITKCTGSGVAIYIYAHIYIYTYIHYIHRVLLEFMLHI